MDALQRDDEQQRMLATAKRLFGDSQPLLAEVAKSSEVYEQQLACSLQILSHIGQPATPDSV